MRVGVVTDSTADLPQGIAEQYGVEFVPLCITWDEQTYLDRVELSATEYYRRLRTSATLPTTGVPSPWSFQQAYESQLARFDAVVSLHISSKLSATVDSARIAADQIDRERITVLDSGTFTIGLGWLVELAARLGHEGTPPWEIKRAVGQMAQHIQLYAALDTLEGLVRGGRIGRARSLVGALLKIKPIIAIRDGEVLPVTQARTREAAHRRLVETVVGLAPLERLGVVHGDASEAADRIERELRERAPDMVIDRGEIGSVIGTHSGPGAVAVGVLLRG